MARFNDEKNKAEGHVRFCTLLYRHQLRNGLHFLHEHPWGASSWRMTEIVEIADDPRVETVETHMCRFGMTSHIGGRDDDHGLVKKPTGFMTSSRCVATQLSKKCDGTQTTTTCIVLSRSSETKQR